MEKLFPAIRSRIGFWKIRYDYYSEALLSYCLHKLKGGNTYSRLNAFPGCNFIRGSKCSDSSERLAIFVAFHSSTSVPQSNLDYLKALAGCRFRIIYIHNGPLDKASVELLSNNCEQILCRENIGQDMGAWKDGIQHLEANSMLNCVEWLLLCNDSNLFLGGSHSNAFQKLFGNELKRADLDLICLSRNFESWMHCGSFFLCFHRNLFKSDQFKLFWRKYLPLSHRHHAIENGEIKLSREVIQNSRISVLYDSLALYREIRSGAYHAGEVFPLLPLGAFYLAKGKSLTRPIDPVRMQCIFATLDTRHPSHVYALLFIKFLRSPFMKKDLFRQGVFCQTQLAQLLESIGIVYEGIQWNECIDALTKDGSNLSYLNYGKVAFRKGVYSEGLGIIQGRGEYLSGLGVSHLI